MCIQIIWGSCEIADSDLKGGRGDEHYLELPGDYNAAGHQIAFRIAGEREYNNKPSSEDQICSI